MRPGTRRIFLLRGFARLQTRRRHDVLDAQKDHQTAIKERRAYGVGQLVDPMSCEVCEDAIEARLS